MTDRREDILSRIKTILDGIPGYNVYRNRGDLPKLELPALVLLDADEDVPLVPGGAAAPAKARPASAPVLVRLKPEIYVALKNRGTQNTGVGEDLSAARVTIIKAIMQDNTLPTSVGNNGQITYVGCQADMGYRRELEGKLLILFSFTYPLIMSEL